MFYILEGRNVISCDESIWSDWIEKNFNKRTIATTITDDYYISTVFLTLDHNYNAGDPILFETMIFESDGSSIYVRRHKTFDEAEEGHKEAKEWLSKYLVSGVKREFL